MTIRTAITTLAIFLTLALASVAQANVINFEDTVNHWDGWGTWRQNHQDVIGIPDFTTGSVTVENGNTLTAFSMDYTVGSNYNGFNSLTSGDLFINTDDDTSWNYVVHLNGTTGGSAAVYAFNADYDDASAYVMGTYPGGGYRDNHPASAIVDGLDPVAYVMWNGLIDAAWNNTEGTVSITGLDIQYDVLTVAYTVSCANDVVFQSGISQTPIPGAVWLLGSGLAGLVGLRRRNRTA